VSWAWCGYKPELEDMIAIPPQDFETQGKSSIAILGCTLEMILLHPILNL